MASIEAVDINFAKQAYSNYLRKRAKCDNNKGCHIPVKAPRSDGYVRWSITKGSTKAAFKQTCGERTFYLHHLAWYITGNPMPVPTKEHLSHLCGDSRCFNPDHLAVESPTANNSRKNCLVTVECPCCTSVIWTCRHDPKCIPTRM